MRKAARAVSGVLTGTILSLFLASSETRPPDPQQTAQEQPPQDVQKPKYDYMSTFPSQNTRPLGLREDPAVRRMLGQGSVLWAIRAGSRHILD